MLRAGLQALRRALVGAAIIFLNTVLGGSSSEAQSNFDAPNERFEQQLIGLISFSTLPGFTSGTLDIKRDAPSPNYSIDKLTIGGDDTLSRDGQLFDLFVEGAVGISETDEKSFDLGSIDGTSVAVKTDRTVAFGRVGVGPSIPIADRIRLRPVISAAISRFRNETGLGEVDESTGSIGEILNRDFTLWGLTLGGSLQARFEDTFGDTRLEAQASLTQAYTNIFDAPLEELDASGWTTFIALRARWLEMTDVTVFGQPLGYNLFSTINVPAGAGRSALGFHYLVEVGAGLDLDLRDKGLFFVEGLRPRASVTVGDNVSGFNIGASVRF